MTDESALRQAWAEIDRLRALLADGLRVETWEEHGAWCRRVREEADG